MKKILSTTTSNEQAPTAAGAEASSATTTSASDPSKLQPTFEQVAAAGNPEAATEFISGGVTAQLARLMSVEAAGIDARRGSILALGLDSLVAVELRNWVMRQFDAVLQSADILGENQTVRALAGTIVARSRQMTMNLSMRGAGEVGAAA